MSADVKQIAREVEARSAFVHALRATLDRVIVGQRPMVDALLIGLLTGGHILLEGVPGLAKTLTVNTLAQAIDARFRRIQFTPDLLPADLVGTLIYDPRDGSFRPRRGPIFANIVLADEINRAPAKVQSALLEAMQEKQVTIGEETHRLEEPFLVLATQNPIEQEGTYPLPEAQVDRFLLKVLLGYPSREEERLILDRMSGTRPPAKVTAVVAPAEILKARETVDTIYIDEKVKDYIVALVQATRRADELERGLGKLIEYGASPRGTLAIAMASRARAFLEGRGYVTPQDVKAVALEALRHRVIPSFEAEAEELSSDAIIQKILDRVPVP